MFVHCSFFTQCIYHRCTKTYTFILVMFMNIMLTKSSILVIACIVCFTFQSLIQNRWAMQHGKIITQQACVV